MQQEPSTVVRDGVVAVLVLLLVAVSTVVTATTEGVFRIGMVVLVVVLYEVRSVILRGAAVVVFEVARVVPAHEHEALRAGQADVRGLDVHVRKAQRMQAAQGAADALPQHARALAAQRGQVLEARAVVRHEHEVLVAARVQLECRQARDGRARRRYGLVQRKRTKVFARVQRLEDELIALAEAADEGPALKK